MLMNFKKRFKKLLKDLKNLISKVNKARDRRNYKRVRVCQKKLGLDSLSYKEKFLKNQI